MRNHETSRAQLIAAGEVALLAVIQGIRLLRDSKAHLPETEQQLILVGLTLANDLERVLRTNMVETYFAMLGEHGIGPGDNNLLGRDLGQGV